MLNLSRLRVLCEVCRRGSFSAAADALCYTQSAVSQAIARLEAETGAELVVRARGGVRPTAAGAALVERADAIFATVQAAEDELAAVLGLRAGHLRVASFPSAGAALMPRAIAIFRARHPGVTITMAEGEPEEIAPRLAGGEFDLALLFTFPGVGERFGAELRCLTLMIDPMLVALPAGHRLARLEHLRLGDLRDEEWIQTAAHSPCARHVVRCCQAAGFEPTVSFESDDYDIIQGLVAAGVGVALVPRLALGGVHPGIVVRELEPASPTRTVIAATPRGAAATPAARTMLQILGEVVRDGVLAGA